MYKMILSGVATMILFAAGSRQAQAADYGAFVIRNPTTTTIYYQVKWGDGQWRSYSIAPGYRQWHSYRLNEYGKAPIPYVRFDYIGGDADVTFKTYRMQFYAVDNRWYGKSHVFRYDSSGRYLVLYSE